MNKNRQKDYRVLIAGGGTGGHLFPAIAIGEELEKCGFNIKFMGSKYGIESNSKHIDQDSIYLMDIKGIQRSFNIRSILSNLMLPLKIIRTYMQVNKVIRQFKPNLVIGTGGYACALPVYAAIHKRVLTAIQEQNVLPGMVTNFFYKKVDVVFTSFPETMGYLDSKNIVCTGNPTRKNIVKLDRQESLIKLNLDPSKNTILIIGGSQGAKSINNHFSNSYQKYLDKDIQIIWQVGLHSMELIDTIKHKNIRIFEFIDDMGLAYSASDIVVSRAGATAISEILFLEKPSILIPYPYAANNHQEINGNVLSKAGASIMVMENEFSKGKLEDSIIDLLKTPSKIKSYGHNASQLSKKNSAELISKEIIKRINSARR